MRVCRAPARDALAAPSSFVQLLNQLFFQMGKGRRDGSSLFGSTAVVGEYSTALARLRQHLFFDRQHHARPDQPRRRVVEADRDERPALVVDAHIRAVFRPVRDGRAHRRAVPRAPRVFGR